MRDYPSACWASPESNTQQRVFIWYAIVYHTTLATLGGSSGADGTTLAKMIAQSYLRDSKLLVGASDAMTIFAEALARGVQRHRHGAALALFYTRYDRPFTVSVCGVVQDVPPIAKKRSWAREWVPGCRLWMRK